MTAAVAGRPPRRRSNLRLVAHQVRYEQLSFWRNPQSAIFTFVFPVVFVTIMGALFRSMGRSSYFGGLSALQYYVPTIRARIARRSSGRSTATPTARRSTSCAPCCGRGRP